jgi:molybdopterin/thiamine biosynthesis adenylyltransferase
MNDEQLLRYSRQLMLNGFDVAGQEALLAAKVLIVGLGGLGSPVALYLAAAGVGSLVLADSDSVEVSNLQRQIIHKHDNVGMGKVLSAQNALLGLNPGVQLELIDSRLEGELLHSAVAGCNAVVDCTDNFRTRFALNESCWKHQVPLISAAAIRMEAQLSVFDPRKDASPCYQCLYSEGSDGDLNCSENGVMAPLVGMLGSMQALECIKVLSGYGTPLVGKLLLVDALTMQIRTMNLNKNPSCPVCRH